MEMKTSQDLVNRYSTKFRYKEDQFENNTMILTKYQRRNNTTLISF
jgi:hypothetical protein